MMIYGFYIAAVIGALGLYFMLPHGWSMARFGGLLGAAALGVLMLVTLPDAGLGPGAFYYIFTAISLAAAARVITHPRPVYSALYFVLVVLSSSGMLVLLDAEFMAFAMVIIYGGAILVTYMFVIMLATMPQSAREPDASPEYDRIAREPLAAVVMGFALAAVLGSVLISSDVKANSNGFSAIVALDQENKRVEASNPIQRGRLEQILRGQGKMEAGEAVLSVDLSGRKISVVHADSLGSPRVVEMDDTVVAALVPNIDNVGLNLFRGHTLGIELAAVILLLSMVGAIVIARQPVPGQVMTGYEMPPPTTSTEDLRHG